MNLENNNIFLSSLFVVVVAIHLFMFKNTKPATTKALTFSKKSSKMISVKVQISNNKNSSMKESVVIKKESKNISKQKTKSMKKAAKNQVVEKEEVNKDQGENSELALYRSNVRFLINKNKRYPKTARRLRHEGRLRVELLIDSDGSIASKKYLEESKSIFLNAATEDIFKKVKNFGQIPKSIKERPLKVIVPINYRSI